MSNPFERHGIGHLSASSLNLWAAEPALWIMERLLGRRSPSGIPAARGKAVEAGVNIGLHDPALSVEACIAEGHAELEFDIADDIQSGDRIDLPQAIFSRRVFAKALIEGAAHGIGGERAGFKPLGNHQGRDHRADPLRFDTTGPRSWEIIHSRKASAR